MDLLTKGDSAFSIQNGDERVAASSEPKTERGPGSSSRFGAEDEGELSQHRSGIRKRSRSVSSVPHFGRLLGLPRAAGALVAVGILLISIVAVSFIICLKGTAVGGDGSGAKLFTRGASRRLADGRHPSENRPLHFTLGEVEKCIADVESTSDDEESGSLTHSSSGEAEDAGQGSGGPWAGRQPLLVTQALGLLRARGFVSLLVFSAGILMLVYSFSPALLVPAIAALSAAVGYVVGSAGDGLSGSKESKALEKLVTSARFKGWCLSLLLILAVAYLLTPSMLPVLVPLLTLALASSLWKGDLEDMVNDGDFAAGGSEDSPVTPEEEGRVSDYAAAATGAAGLRRRRKPRP